MPFDVKTAPSSLMRTQYKTFSDLVNKIIIIYYDDNLVFSQSIEEHLRHLRTVFERIKKAGMTLKPQKCFFFKTEITFLGYRISKSGIDSDPDKVRAIVDFPTPQNSRHIRSFVGLAGFYRRKVKDFAKIAEPLTRLTKKEHNAYAKHDKDKTNGLQNRKQSYLEKTRPIVWGPEQESAFNALKQAIISSPVLVHFNNKYPIEVHTDGSLSGIGGILYHVINAKLFPFCFQSWLLHGSEKSYTISEIECLAIVKITIKCQQHLLGTKFTVVTDQVALKWLSEKKSLKNRLLRWSLHLQGYDYVIKHRSGKLNVDADALSRFPVSPGVEMDDNLERHCLLTSRRISGSDNDNSFLNKETLAEFQKSYYHYGKIYKMMKKPEACIDCELFNSYVIDNNILYKKVKVNHINKLVVCLPLRFRLETLYSYHDDPLSGAHLGTAKTVDKIMNRYYWPSMRKDIIDYVRSCTECQTKKKPLLPPAGLMIPITKKEPFEMVGCDFLGRFKLSHSGNT
jgi:hypothetical protein